MTYPAFIVALWALARHRRSGDSAGDLLDAAIIAAGGGAVLWAFVLGPAVHATGLAPLAHVVSAVYPGMDLVVFAMLVRLLVGARRNGAMQLLVASFVALLLSDTLYAVLLAHGAYHVGGPNDGIWMFSYLLVGVAGVHAAARSFPNTSEAASYRLSPQRLGFLGAALVTGPILLATRTGDAAVEGALSVATFLLVMARTTWVNRRLAAARHAVEHKTHELRHQALHDALTGLPNRALITDRVAQLLARSRRNGTVGAALFIDLDGFKTVNDTLGHDAGDRLLQAVAERLRGAVREADTIGRLGGDEFVVLIDDASLQAAPELVAERILEVMRHPFEIHQATMPITVTTSIGIAAGLRETPGELLRDADVALYQAKAAGKNCYEIFHPEMETVIQRRYELEMDLRSALAEHQFRLMYQPIYDLDNLDLVGVEALLRWDHPTLGVVSAAEFVPILESSGQIVDVGRWVLQEACTQMAAWRAAGHDLIVSVNVSGRQLDRDSVIDHVREALALSGLEPGALTLEITETTLMRNVDATARRLHELKSLCVQVAIDDFGTGYSSLAYLQRFPVDCLKIDRAFTEAIARSPESDALVHTLVQLGRDLGLKTLAEGVETTQQIDQLREERVNQVQGFLLAKPLPAETVEHQLLNVNAAHDYDSRA